MPSWLKRALLGCLALCLLGSLLWAVRHNDGALNLSVLQAGSFLHHRLDIDSMSEDVVAWHGKLFVPFPPMPAFLLTPVVALVGIHHAKTVMVSLLLTVFNVFTLRRAMTRLGVDEVAIRWLGAAFFLGTGYWPCVYLSSFVYFLAHIVATTFVLLGLDEALGKRRGVLIGLWMGCAFLSRQLTIYSVLFVLACSVVNTHTSKLARVRKLAAAGGAFAVCAGIYMAFNALRFGNPLDTGYSHIQLDGFLQARFDEFGLFSLAYVPFNFTYMFLQGFHASFSDKTMLLPTGMDPFGTSLTVASPFLIFAFGSHGNSSLRRWGFLSIGLCLAHLLCYVNNGSVQLNSQRYALDFMPVLLVLLAPNLRESSQRFWKPAIVYAICLNALALCIDSRFFGLRQ